MNVVLVTVNLIAAGQDTTVIKPGMKGKAKIGRG